MKKEFELEIKIEDIDEVLEEKRDFVVPFAMTTLEKGDEVSLYIEVYSDAVDLAEEFANKYEGKWFSRKAFDELDQMFSSYLKSHGYVKDDYGKYRYYRNFIREESLSPFERYFIRQSTKKIDELEGEFENLTGLTSDDGDFLPDESFVTVIDEKIISVATVNDRSADSGIAEITVKTAKKYRGQGFSTSNVMALIDHLTSKGLKVGYCCSKNNPASINLAKKCGFVPNGKMYAVCGYKND